MSTRTLSYGTRATPTITLASLANGSARESAEVDNSSAGAVDYQVTGKITTGTSPTTNGTISVLVWGGDSTIRGGGNATGSDAGVTLANEDRQCEVGRVIVVDNTNNHTYEFNFSIAALFGGTVPKKFGFIVVNNSGAALNATGGNHEIAVNPITDVIT